MKDPWLEFLVGTSVRNNEERGGEGQGRGKGLSSTDRRQLILEGG